SSVHHRVRRPQMLPVLARELVERHHPLPVAIERARGLGMAALRAPRLERSLLPRGLLSGLGVRNSREQTPRFGLLLERQLVEEVQEAVIPASLLLRLREDGSQRAPDAEMPIADDHLRRRKSAPLEIAQDRRPALGRLAIAALDGEDDLPAVAQRGQHHEDRGLVLLEPGLDVHAVHPEVDDLEIRYRPRLPELVLGLPARLEASNRRRRERRALTEQPAQGQIEVARGRGAHPLLLPAPAARGVARPAARTLPAFPTPPLTPRLARWSSLSQAVSPSVRALVAPEVLTANRRLHRRLSFTRPLTLPPG